MSVILLLLAAAVAAPAWWTTRRPWWWALPTLALGLAGVAAVLTEPVTSAVGRFTERPAPAVVAGVLAAVVVGGPLTTAVLRAVSGRSAPRAGPHQTRSRPDAAIASAADVLRGGAWIGALERLAVVTSLLAGWPEGLAVVLAVKGLGRYPELRHPGAAERFIIGTFCSVLWAAGCAGAVTLVIA